MTGVLALAAVITLIVTLAGSGVLFYIAAYTDTPARMNAKLRIMARRMRRTR